MPKERPRFEFEDAYGHKISNQTFLEPYKPVEVDNVTLAFPAEVVGKLLPAYNLIPEEFRRDRTKWNKIVNTWFACGLEEESAPKVRAEFDKDKVWRHLSACMRSYEPRHEHKTAGVAYLMSLWMEPLVEKAA